MTVEEIFNTLAAHMKKGIALHWQYSEAYNFLNLKGYKKCHFYHYLSEIKNYNSLCHYYMSRYHKLINPNKIDEVEVIPSSWYKYVQFSVDTNTKRNAVKDMMKSWVEWEHSTKELIQTLYKELFNLNELAAAKKFCFFLQDVDEELKDAENKRLKLESSGYDIIYILDKQEKMYDKYKEKIKNLFKDN